MIINLNVQAEVIDIRTDYPQQSDIFLIDTNVWVWQTYPNARTSPTKIREYGAYLKKSRQNGATLAYSGLVLAELAHVIERTECEIYNERRRIRGEALDGYDLLILEAMFNADPGQVKVITDDMDYATVPNIQLFTGNNRVIQAAITQGKLLHR